MPRHAVALLMALAILAAPLAAGAQPTKPARPEVETLREGLRELGDIESQILHDRRAV